MTKPAPRPITPEEEAVFAPLYVRQAQNFTMSFTLDDPPAARGLISALDSEVIAYRVRERYDDDPLLRASSGHPYIGLAVGPVLRAIRQIGDLPDPDGARARNAALARALRLLADELEEISI